VNRREKIKPGPLQKSRFCALWNQCRISDDGEDAGDIWASLFGHFAEAHRHYHDDKHMTHCLTELDAAHLLMDSADVVEMALWFHDAIYNPGAPDNEQRSADLFEHFARGSLNSDFIEEVRGAILDTTHQRLPTATNARYVVDIDLSSFGLPWQAFMADSHALRKEQKHLSDEEFFPKKCAFLHSLLARTSIYSTDYFRDRYEAVARSNISRYLGLFEK